MFNFKKGKKIVFIYLILGLSWVYFSDNYFLTETANLAEFSRMQLYKELIFVLATTIMFYLILNKYQSELKSKEEKLEKKDEKLKDYNHKTSSMNRKLEKSFHEMNELNKKFVNMINIVSKLNDNNILNEDEFLSELLHNAIEIVPEADYGKIYTVEADNIRFIDSIGHNFEVLKKIKINKKHISNYNTQEVYHSKDYSINLSTIPKDKRKYFIKALRPIKESIYIDIAVNERMIGRISLDIAKENSKVFNKLSVPVLESFATLASSFFAFKRYDSLQGRFTKELISSIIKMLEMYDLYTKGHSENVANLSMLLAEEMGLSDKMIMDAYWAGMVHDIGKLLIPTKILNKRSKLEDSEYEMIQHHAVWGSKSLSDSSTLKHISKYIRHHHERWEGNGYPSGLEGNEIPLISQILSVTDTWDAMTSNRAYRNALSKDEALNELKKNKGTQFSPVVVDTFIEIMEAGKINVSKRVEDKFNKSELEVAGEQKREYIDQLFDHVEEGIIMLDKDFNIQNANEYFFNMFGFNENEVIGFNVRDMIVPAEKIEEVNLLFSRLAGGNEIDVKTYRKKKSGDRIDVKLHAFKVDESENDFSYYAVYNNISDLENIKKKYEKLKVKYNLIFENENSYN